MRWHLCHHRTCSLSLQHGCSTPRRPLAPLSQGAHGWDVLRALDQIRAGTVPGSLDAHAAAAIEKRVRKVGLSVCCVAEGIIPRPASARCGHFDTAGNAGWTQLLQDTPEGQWHCGAAAWWTGAHHVRVRVSGRDAHACTMVRDPGKSAEAEIVHVQHQGFSGTAVQSGLWYTKQGSAYALRMPTLPRLICRT